MDNIEKLHFRDIFSGLSEGDAQKTAFECGGESFTYAQLDHAIDLCASDLIEMGVRPKDHVGVWSFNSANSLIAFFAIIRAGAVAVMCNYSLTYEEISDQLSGTDVKFLLYGNTVADRNDAELPRIICESMKIQGMDICPQSRTYMGRREDALHKAELDELAKVDDAHRDAFIIFTTGTTSKPKAVLDHQEGLMINSYRFIENRKPLMGDSVCIALPMFHVFGLHMIVAYFINRAKVCLTDMIGADNVINTVTDNNCTDIATVTSVYLNIVEHSDFPEISGRVHLLTTAGGAITPAQFMKLEMAFQKAKLFNEYGQTEAHGSILMCRWDDPIEKRAFTVGKPFAPGEVVIRDADHKELPPMEPGEIEVKGRTVMNGYYKLPDEKAQDDDGWLHTGDLGAIDKDGYIQLVGRSKDMIIKNGVNIAPTEVEKAVSELKGIRQVKVYGIKHWIWGESVECCVCLEDGAELDEQACKEELKKKLANEKIPSHIIAFKEFPVAPNGKLDAKNLRIQLVNILRHMYVEQQIDKGVECLDLHIKCADYSIVPTSAMLRAVAESVFPDHNKSEKICLAVEEFLRIRIIENIHNVGKIRVRCIFYKQWLTIEFSDEGENYYIEKNVQTSMCAKLIFAVVDNFVMDVRPDKPTCYRMEFLYPGKLNIEEFLIAQDHVEL